LKLYADELLGSVFLEAFVHGNTTLEEASAICDDVLEILQKKNCCRPLFSSQMTRDRELRIDNQASYSYEEENTTHSNSAVELLLQTGVENDRENGVLELLAQILSEPAYDTLRTKEQLGYIVFSGARRSNGTQGIRVIVQGDKDPRFAERRIEAFLRQARSDLESMEEAELEEHRQALITRKLDRPRRLSSLAGLYWGEIQSQQYHFDRENVEVEELKGVTKGELLQYFDARLSKGAPKRRKLCVRVLSTPVKSARQTNQPPEVENGGRRRRRVGRERAANRRGVRFQNGHAPLSQGQGENQTETGRMAQRPRGQGQPVIIITIYRP
ncbi:MAG: hypothetical protein GY820_17615, partial [Gammaproteobacteria bacterium]|nr:hypothetical protein [Gammaproteobacteria bacterium]